MRYWSYRMGKNKIQTDGKKITFPTFQSKTNTPAVRSNDNRKEFAFEENKREYRAINTQNKIGCCLQIDGVLYDADDGEKCDFGLLLEDGRFYLIELKGNNIPKAYSQLIETRKKLISDYKDFSFTFYGRIVCASGKKKNVPEATTVRQQAEKGFGSKIIVKEKIEENI